jgi:hypothetical protein
MDIAFLLPHRRLPFGKLVSDCVSLLCRRVHLRVLELVKLLDLESGARKLNLAIPYTSRFRRYGCH